MDPGPRPQFVLDDLSLGLAQTKEMLIAPIHVVMQAHTVYGGQMKYSGHICNFVRDTSEVCQLLPILPEECEVIQIQWEGPDHVLGHDVQHLYYVWHQVVQQWLEWLVEHHPAYHQVTISQENLSQLPEGGSVHGHLQSIRISEVGDEGGGDDIVGPSNGDETDGALGGRALFTSGFIPNVNEERVSEFQNLCLAAQVGQEPILMPHIESQPVSEWHNNPIASRAFPSLFPFGQADFHTPHQKPVSFSEWASHLMRYEDGHFARHPHFHYWALNTIMCTQAKKDSSWYLTTHSDE